MSLYILSKKLPKPAKLKLLDKFDKEQQLWVGTLERVLFCDLIATKIRLILLIYTCKLKLQVQIPPSICEKKSNNKTENKQISIDWHIYREQNAAMPAYCDLFAALIFFMAAGKLAMLGTNISYSIIR